MKSPLPTLCVGLTLLPLLLTLSCSKEAKADRHQSRAQEFIQQNQYDAAEIELRNLLRLEPQNAQAIRQLGLLYFDQGRLPQAAALLRSAKETSPDDLEVRVKLGMTYLTARQIAEARAEVNFVLERDPKNEAALLLLADTAVDEAATAEVERRLGALATAAGDIAAYHVALGSVALRQRRLDTAEAALSKALSLDPNSSAAHLALSNLYGLRNDPEKAEAELAKAAELAPPRSMHRLRYAELKIRQGDAAAGRGVLEEIVKQAPDYLPALLRIAELELAQRKYDDCYRTLGRILARDQINYEALLLSGRLSLARGDRAKAVTEYERMATVYGKSPQVHYQLGVAHLLNNDMTKALASLRQATTLDPQYAEAVLLLADINLRRGDLNSVIASLNRLLEQQPRLAQGHLLLAGAYRARGNLDEALRVYGQLKELNPSNPQPSWFIGLVLLQQQKPAEARTAFEEALGLAPDYLPAIEQLVNLDIGEKQFDRARDRVTAAMSKNPELATLQFLLARIDLADGKIESAESALNRAIGFDPEFRPAYLALARIYVTSKRQDQALANLAELLRKNPNDVNALMLTGMIQSELGDHRAARDAYEKLLAAAPNSSAALNNLAYLYSERLGNPERAYELAQKARELAPNDPFSADTFGWILFKRGDYAWALSLLQESAAKLPNEPEVQYHLGMTHYMLGEEQPARLALGRALELEKDFPGKDDCAQRLAILDLGTRVPSPEDLALIRKQIAQHPDDVIALLRLAAVHERQGDYAAARDAYDQALKASPKSLPARKGLARLLADRLNQPDRAIELARQVREESPDDLEIAHLLGRLVFEKGDHKWALSLLEQSARAPSRTPALLYDLARAQYSQGRVDDARINLRQALDSGTDFAQAPDARQFLELIAAGQDPDAASKAVAQAREILGTQPNHVPALMVSARSREAQGDFAGARQDYAKALTVYPAFAPASKALALLLVERLEQPELAYEPASKAREAMPSDPEVAKALGIAAYARKDYRRAVQLLSESARQRPDDAQLRRYLDLAQRELEGGR